MSLFTQYATDAQKENEGIKYVPSFATPNKDTTMPTFTIGRAVGRNTQYAKIVTEEVAPYRNLIRTNSLDEKSSFKINLRIFCRGVLLGWDHVFDEKEQLIPFTLENALSMMQRLPELYDELTAESNSAARFRAEIMEGDAKNS